MKLRIHLLYTKDLQICSHLHTIVENMYLWIAFSIAQPAGLH